MSSYESMRSVDRVFKAVVALVLMLLPMAASAQGAARPKMVFDSLNIELDTLYQTDSVKVFDIAFRNEGNADLLITEVAPDCPCLHIDFDTKPYPPGAKGVIRITFHLSVPPQEIDKGIFVYSNATRYDQSIDIRFHGWLFMDKDTPLPPKF